MPPINEPPCPACGYLPGEHAAGCPEWEREQRIQRSMTRLPEMPICKTCGMPGYHSADCPHFVEAERLINGRRLERIIASWEKSGELTRRAAQFLRLLAEDRTQFLDLHWSPLGVPIVYWNDVEYTAGEINQEAAALIAGQN